MEGRPFSRATQFSYQTHRSTLTLGLGRQRQYSPALGPLAVKSILDGFFSATYEKRKADAPLESQLLLCGSHPTSGRLGFFWSAPYSIHLLGRCSYIFASSASKPATKHQTSVLYILFDNLILFLKTRQSFLLCQNYLLYALNISLL